MLQLENIDFGILLRAVLVLITATLFVDFSLLLLPSNSDNITIKSKSGMPSSSKLTSNGIKAFSALMLGTFSSDVVQGVMAEFSIRELWYCVVVNYTEFNSLSSKP